MWHGLSKNAHEGLGSPARILPFTFLLGAGQVLPFVLLWTSQWRMAAVAAGLALLPRLLAAKRFHQPIGSALLHPLGVLALLGIQWAGLLRYLRGKPAMWKGRSLAGDRVPAANAGEQIPQRIQNAIH
ncbi:hypothetical protein BH20VER1_BH20VER1_17040 [soil metagenome]